MNVPQVVINSKVGPLPASAPSFYCSGSTQVFQVSGSVFASKIGLVGTNILIDGNNVGTCTIYANEINSHKACVEQPVITHLTPGSHQIQLTAINAATTTDFNDHFNVLMSDLG